MRGSHAVSYVPVGWVGEEKLPLSRQRCADVLLALNILLAAVDHSNVACEERGSGHGSAWKAQEPRCPLQARHEAGQHADADMDPALQVTHR